jgi:hypothetical protein
MTVMMVLSISKTIVSVSLGNRLTLDRVLNGVLYLGKVLEVDWADLRLQRLNELLLELE